MSNVIHYCNAPHDNRFIDLEVAITDDTRVREESASCLLTVSTSGAQPSHGVHFLSELLDEYSREFGQSYGWPRTYEVSLSNASTNIPQGQVEFQQASGINEEDFRWKLLRSFEDEPLEDGFIHPAEHLMEAAFRTHQSKAATWLQSVYHEHQKHPSLAAAILRCIGRLNRERVYPLGDFMVVTGLSHPDVEVRDAAVRTVEMWGDATLCRILKKHDETESWLKNYIDQVIADLED